VTAQLDRAERNVEDRSVALKKPLGLRDLVLTQIVFVVGSSWVGTAAKLGPSHLFFWLLAILLFYIPQAAVVIYLNRLMPLEGGIYQWAKLGFNEFAGFMVAWNLWLLSITVIALGGMFVTTNLSYAIGAAWMPNSKLCVSFISCALVAGLGWTGMRGLSLGKWVHNTGGFAMLLAYGALIVLPFVSLARGELKEYHPLQIAAPAMSIFFCLNIFSKLAVGGLSGFEYVAILAGEARAPARNIGHDRFSIDRPHVHFRHQLRFGSRRKQSNRSYRSGAANIATGLSFFSNRRRHRFGGDFDDDGSIDFSNQRSSHRQLAAADGCWLGPAFARLVLAFTPPLQNADQFDFFRGRHHARNRDSKPDRRWNPGGISTRGQCRQRFLWNRLSRSVRYPDCRREHCATRCTTLVANRRDLRLRCLPAGDLLHCLSNHRCSESADFRGQNHQRDSNCEYDRPYDFSDRRDTTSSC